MKQLKLANIGYPIYTIETTFTYRKVGKPTVFDELLMSLAIDFPQLKQNSLAQIAEILKLDENFIHQSLTNMHDTGMIEINEMDDLSQIQITDLSLTNIGKQFYKNKQMPGRRRTANSEFYFNPISQKYDDEPATSEKFDVSLTQNLFPINNDILQDLSQREVPYQNWYTEEVTVEEDGIEHHTEQQAFQAVNVQLNLDNNLHLYIDSTNRLFNDWLKSRSAEIIKEYLLEPLLKNDNQIINNYFNGENFQLDYQENELLSFVLPSDQSDMSTVKYAIPIQMVKDKKIDENTPTIILSDNHEAKLKGKHLWVGAELQKDKSIIQLFFNIKDNNVFIEKIGYFSCYFDHQPYELPVKILIKQQQNWFKELSDFDKPNFDTLVFMANFLSENELLAKISKMSLSEFDLFYQKINQTWNKKLNLNIDWIKKIDLISDEKDLKIFVKYFNKIPLSLQYFTRNIQSQLFDLSLKNEQSPINQIVELASLFNLYSSLKSLNDQKLDLKTITSENLNHIQNWQNNLDELQQNYPAVLSDNLKKVTNKIIAWKTKVQTLFVQSSKKIAVLDTNFVRKNSQDELTNIAKNYQVILPSIILDELDYQKEKNKKDIEVAENILYEKKGKAQAKWNKVDKLTKQIEIVNTKLQAIQSDLDAMQTKDKPLHATRQKDGSMLSELKALEQEINELVREKQQDEKSAKQIDNEQEAVQKELDKLNKQGFEIREAVRKIEDLALSKDSEQSNDDILALLGINEQNTSKNSQNDNEILAVALRYKLCDIIFYSYDKNLKNKIIAYQIQTN